MPPFEMGWIMKNKAEKPINFTETEVFEDVSEVSCYTDAESEALTCEVSQKDENGGLAKTLKDMENIEVAQVGTADIVTVTIGGTDVKFVDPQICVVTEVGYHSQRSLLCFETAHFRENDIGKKILAEGKRFAPK